MTDLIQYRYVYTVCIYKYNDDAILRYFIHHIYICVNIMGSNVNEWGYCQNQSFPN